MCEPKRVPAAETCRERGWHRGTLLTASRWPGPRRILRVDLVEVHIAQPRSDGRTDYRHLQHFPADVREVARG